MSTYVNVRFVPLDKSADAKANETLLDAARRANVPLGNSCGGIGVCARCRVRVIEGAENLSAPTSVEERVSKQRDLAADERLACQAVVLGDCAVTTTYW
jgi:2Fe-2S ferredoxin